MIGNPQNKQKFKQIIWRSQLKTWECRSTFRKISFCRISIHQFELYLLPHCGSLERQGLPIYFYWKSQLISQKYFPGSENKNESNKPSEKFIFKTENVSFQSKKCYNIVIPIGLVGVDTSCLSLSHSSVPEVPGLDSGSQASIISSICFLFSASSGEV